MLGSILSCVRRRKENRQEVVQECKSFTTAQIVALVRAPKCDLRGPILHTYTKMGGGS